MEAEKEIVEFTKQKEEIERNENFVSWGIETEHGSMANEPPTNPDGEFYKKDPKKYLKDFFEREGLEMEFESDQLACGKNRIGFTVKLQLPLEDGNGKPLFAEITMEGKKREVIRACCMEACRILDSSGILRESNYISARKRKSAVRAENDYYSSDEDSFLDRTGELECKREKRMKKDGRISELSSGVETYASLQKKLTEIQTEILKLETQIQIKHKHENESIEDLDQFMIELNSNSDKKSISKLKFKLDQLKIEETRLSELTTIAKPSDILLSPKYDEKKEETLHENVEEIPEKIVKNVGLQERGHYGLNLAPENRKQDYLKRSAEVENKDLENPGKKVYSVELPPHLKAILECKSDETNTEEQIQPEGDYVDWMPPTDQSGDGTTKLNDELGY